MNKKITFTQALLTSVGCLIGSGIYFRADNILGATKGNVALAILGWIVLGSTLVFAGITVAVLAGRTTREGGVIAYLEDTYGKFVGFLGGWFYAFLYTPTLIGILGVVAADYFLQLLGSLGMIQGSTTTTMYITAFILITICFAWNYFSTKFAALFSSAATVIKLFPIILIGVIGLANFNVETATGGFSSFDVGLFTAPFISMAFAFDGWITVGSLSRDMENPQKDIAKVLSWTAIIVTAAYTLYFTGVTMLMDAQEIIALGNDHVGKIAEKVLGGAGMSVILFCVVISVMGTLNGNMMASPRYTHALAQAKDLPNSEFFAKTNKYGTTGNSAILAMVVNYAAFALYAIQAFAKDGVDTAAQEAGNYLFGGIAFDDIPIATSSIFYLLLFVAVVRIGIKEGNGILKTWIAPIIAFVGQAYVIFSFIQGNSQAIMYLGLCVVILAIGVGVRSIANKNQA